MDFEEYRRYMFDKKKKSAWQIHADEVAERQKLLQQQADQIARQEAVNKSVKALSDYWKAKKGAKKNGQEEE